MSGLRQELYAWLDARLDLAGMRRYAAEKTVPHHKLSLFYYLGGATLFLFTVQVASGVLLALYYRPSAAEAHASVKHIITVVPFGDLVRSVHAWSADLMIGMLFAHLFTVWLTRAYRAPREPTWFFGALLLGVCIGLGFTGYLLPWNELSYFATRVGTEIAGHVPLIGGWMRSFLRGGDDVTSMTLSRFFGFHIAFLPAAATFLLVAHLLFVQRQGISTPESIERKGNPKTIPFFPHMVLRDAAFWLVLLAVVVSLASFAPRELGLEADPFKAAPAHIKPEWYFLFMFELLKLLPATVMGFEGESIGIVGFLFAFLLILVLPFLDRAGRSIYRWAGWLALLLFAGLTIYGWLDH